MTGREVVQKSITFSRPDRIPFDMSISGSSDVYSVNRPRSRKSIDSSGNIFIDHFGCQFDIINKKTMGQPTNFPISDIKKLDEFQFPDPLDESLYSKLERVLKKAGNNYVSVYFIWFTFFERMHFLHGFEQTLVDLYEEPSLMMELADRIIEYNLTIVREIGQRFPGKVHGIAMSDDWGTQNSTLISPTLFKEFFLPRYKKLCRAIRDQGMDTWLHSCGYVIDFIPFFIDSGVQVLNLQQPRIFDLHELGKYKGSVCFSIPIDIQNTMPTGSREEIREEARELVKYLSIPDGGFIANEHPDYEGNGIDPIKGKWAYEAFQEADPFRQYHKDTEKSSLKRKKV